MSKTPFYKTGLGTYQGQTSDGALLYSSPLFLTEEEKLKLKEKGEKQYGDKTTTTTSKKVEGGTEYTDTTKQHWTAEDKYAGKTYAEAGVDPDEAKKYWEENPEEYQAYLASKNKTRTGTDKSVTTRFVADPKEQTPPPWAPDPNKRYNIQGWFGGEDVDISKRRGLNHDQLHDFQKEEGYFDATTIPEYEKMFKAKQKYVDKNYGEKGGIEGWAKYRGWDPKQLQDGSELSKKRLAWIDKNMKRFEQKRQYLQPHLRIQDAESKQWYRYNKDTSGWDIEEPTKS